MDTLPKTLDPKEVISSLESLYVAAVRALGNPKLDELGESDSKWIKDGDRIDVQKIETAQLLLLKLGKDIDRSSAQGSPVVLHCLALGKIAKALKKLYQSP
jgi:hypothetical protein